ncbi:MAG: outer membrane beta-barrel protein [Sulfurovaceae bacterium]|jgi:hypothetical protein
MKKIFFIISFIMYGTVFVQANDLSKHFTIGISGVGIFEGYNGDGVDSDFPGFGLRGGYYMTEKLSFVGEILYTRPKYNTQKVDVVDYIGSINYDFGTIDPAVLFVSSGFGYRTINDVADRNDWNFIFGAGVKVPLNDSFQFIVEGKARFDLERSDKGMLGTVGINYLF